MEDMRIKLLFSFKYETRKNMQKYAEENGIKFLNENDMISKVVHNILAKELNPDAIKTSS